MLIVGAGPTGLALALELAARGVACRIVDQAPVRSDKSRAFVVHARTLELLDRHGLADALVARGRTTLDGEIAVGGRTRAELRLADIGVDDTRFPYLLFVSQVETERVLEGALGAAGVQVERPVALVGLTAAGGATLRHGDGTDEVVRARWVVGCDGAHSFVRKAAGMTFEGAPYEQSFMLADARVAWAEPPRLRALLLRDGLLMMIPFPGDMYRFVAAGGPPAPEEPTLADFQARFDAASPHPGRLHDPAWIARFRLHHRGVDRYRAGRLFVAGDAAHIHSPAGGQGMNTGIQDAINLGWKLAMVARGEAPEALLDSYDAERRPVGRRLLEVTDRMFGMLATANRPLLALRNALAPILAPALLASRQRRARAFRFVSQLAIRYRTSPIVAADHQAWAAGPRPGDRAPDGPLDARPLLAAMRDADHRLLVFGPAPYEDPLPPWIRPLHVPPDADEVRARYGIGEAGLYLLRPDRHVAYRAHDLDPAPLRAFLAGAYGWEG